MLTRLGHFAVRRRILILVATVVALIGRIEPRR
jgi:hypothetical protein